MQLSYPKIKIDSKGKYYVYFYQNNKRYRLYNGSRIGSSTNPNIHDEKVNRKMAELLASEIYNFILSGKLVEGFRVQKKLKTKLSDYKYLKIALEDKLNQKYSAKYKAMLVFVFNKLSNQMVCQKLTLEAIKKTLASYKNETSFNSVKRHLNALINHAVSMGLKQNPGKLIKHKKTKAKLHKPFDDLSSILSEIKDFNFNLYLCCLLTYGCLLRPHREIRLLTWGNISRDLNFISLSGYQNKSGKNRIVPIPSYIKKYLRPGKKEENIFSNTQKPFNDDYFKTKWSKFKLQSNLVKKNHTLYSFRHTGAIRLFEKTGSITKLQKAMGHSSMRVSLTYLRGLEIAELKEEDMPMILN